MQDALDKARRFGGGALERRRGGFWTYVGCRVVPVAYYEVPAWAIGYSTIRALIDRAAVRVTERGPSGYPTRVEVVE